MIRSLGAAAALLLFALSSPARSAEIAPARLEPCRALTDGLDRLVCFDAVASEKDVAPASTSGIPRVAGPVYKTVTLTDLQVDAAELRGRRVEVQGVLQLLGDIVMLKEEMLSMNAVFVETKAVPREDRRRMLQLCSQGCTAIVRGQAADVMMNLGIKAEGVEIP